MIERRELSPLQREYMAFVMADHERRLGMLRAELGVPSTVNVEFDGAALTFVVPDPPPSSDEEPS